MATPDDGMGRPPDGDRSPDGTIGVDDADPNGSDARPGAAPRVSLAEEPEIVREVAHDEAYDDESAIREPARVMRIGSMIKQLLDEVHAAPLDDASRVRLKEIYETSVSELAGSLSSDLSDELGRLTHPFSSDTPSDAELRVAKAQLVGWLEGLFHGMQAALFAQQMAARAQLDQMRSHGQLGPGQPQPQGGDPRPGVYL